MPLIKLETSVSVAESQKKDLMQQLSTIAAQTIGKPEAYVMVSVSEASMMMAGEMGPIAHVGVYSIGGLNQSVNSALTQKICKLLGEVLEIPADRVYVGFVDSLSTHWGWNNRTFG